MNELQGKIALVMGAGTQGEGIGNGKATAITFAREGAHVVCADRSRVAAQATVDAIKSEGLLAEAMELDVANEQMVGECVRSVHERHGRIDVLNNNVGIAVLGGVTELSESDWDHVWAVNLKSAVFAMKYVLPIMVRQGVGSIVNISSLASIRYSGVAYATYYASKAALNHLTSTTAAEFAPSGVRVNAVLPGLIKTPMVSNVSGISGAYDTADVEAMWQKRNAQVPMGAMGTPWDVANAALFLASERSAFITGALLPVDGGMSVCMGQR